MRFLFFGEKITSHLCGIVLALNLHKNSEPDEQVIKTWPLLALWMKKGRGINKVR